MASDAVAAPTRWAGKSLADRRSERRALLVDAAFALFGTEGEAAVSVRAVCRACGLNTRYFYESFADTDRLLGAVYDRVAAELAQHLQTAVDAAGGDPAARVRAGIHSVLDFSSADPRRGRVLFTEAHANPVLAGRRHAAQTALMDAVLQQGAQIRPKVDPCLVKVSAAMFTGAMVELARQWLAGNLGNDLDTVVEHAVVLSLTMSRPGPS